MKSYNPGRVQKTAAAFSLVEVSAASFLLGILVLSVFGAFSSGLVVVKASRDNLRATQILVQKMETLRLLTWSQGTNNPIASTNFLASYDPTSRNPGTTYRGVYAANPAPASIPAAYRKDMRQATVTVYWTNVLARGKVAVQSHAMKTFVARYGMQNYVYQ